MDNLNPGVRRTVEWLNERGFPTCDSGDGETHDYECDRAYPYVVVYVSTQSFSFAASEVERLARVLREAGVNVCAMQEERAEGEVNIQATYDPCDGVALIDVHGLCDRVLFPGDAADVL